LGYIDKGTFSHINPSEHTFNYSNNYKDCIDNAQYFLLLLSPQINDNGVISIDNRYNVRTPLSLPLNETNKIIAPYWADVDTRGSGQVFYRQTTDPSLLARASSEIRAAFSNSQNVTITNLLIATWDRVGYYDRKSDKVRNLRLYF